MKIDFQSLPVYWINLADRTDRAVAMTELFERIGNASSERIDAVRKDSYFLGCNLSHQKALQHGMEKGRYPFLVLEDDVMETPFFKSTLDIPDDCHLFYFGISNWNSFPENLVENRLPATSHFEPYGNAFFRIRNVLSAHALLYTDAAICTEMLAVLKEYQRKQWHFDVGYAEAQNCFTCLAPNNGPFFYQDDPKTRWCTSRYFLPTSLAAETIHQRHVRRSETPHLVLFCRHLGGFGGEERLNQTVINSLQHVRTSVFVQDNLKDYGMLPIPRKNLSISRYEPGRFLRFLHKNRNDIDFLLRISPDRYKNESAINRYLATAPYPKIINPAGKSVERPLANFDYIVWECDNAADFGFIDHPKNLILRPPAFQNNDSPPPIGFMPSKPYYLTVFNNYDSGLKGADGLLQILDSLRHPLVWCSSHFGSDAPDHPKLIKMSPDRDTLLMLMRHCQAYINLSRSEGFAWSVFEAMSQDRAVFSRPVGVAREFYRHIIAYETFTELAGLLKQSHPDKVTYPLSAFTESFFVKNLFCLLRPECVINHQIISHFHYAYAMFTLQICRIFKSH